MKRVYGRGVTKVRGAYTHGVFGVVFEAYDYFVVCVVAK